MSLEIKSRAIVLHTTRQGDSSLVVHVLDETAGRQSLYLRGLGKRLSGSAAAAFHPLSVLDVVTVASPRSSLLYLREFTPLFSLNRLRTDIRRSAVAQFICEVLFRSVRPGDGDPELFSWLTETVVRLEEEEGGRIANFPACWLVGYCSRMGFRPEDNWCGEKRPLFNPVSARFENDGADRTERFSPEESLLLHKVLSLPADEASLLPLSAERRNAFSRRMVSYLSHHLGASLDIRSLDVLHAVFSD